MIIFKAEISRKLSDKTVPQPGKQACSSRLTENSGMFITWNKYIQQRYGMVGQPNYRLKVIAPRIFVELAG
ncbi:MAG: hypothetical protein ACLS26_10305 [Eubacterium sp.]